jgi:glucosamine--fructose-6-phosphate aminotransferase (isomerizing)
VASTKAFTAQIVALALLALRLGRLRGTLTVERSRELLESLARVPHLMENALTMSGRMDEAAKWLSRAPNMLYLGRGINYPIALEGALKMKEISYIHAEGYPAGEMKHGPISLINEECRSSSSPAGPSTKVSNVQEVKARGGRVIAITFQGDTELRKVLEPERDLIFDVPAVEEVWSPLLMVIPLQLMAYHTAVRAGRDVDQPRNLAKSVTVE